MACRLLGCLWFAAAAWRCKARDQFIGWDDQARRGNLPRVANNTRFLVLLSVCRFLPNKSTR